MEKTKIQQIEVTKVVEANQKLYINRQEGFIGTGLKKDEFVCNCSDIDDIIVFFKDGKYKMVRARPMDKKRLVETLQRLNQVVAVTVVTRNR